MRSALVRVLRVRPELVAVWVDVFRQMVADNAVPDELWAFVWRDYSCFAQDVRVELHDLVWGRPPPRVCVSAVVSAFSAV
jgi:hypothetical protein